MVGAVKIRIPRWNADGGEPVTGEKLDRMSEAIIANRDIKLPQQETSAQSGSGGAVGSVSLGTAVYVSSQTTPVEIPIYDVDDPETQIGTATQEVYTSITWRLLVNGEEQDVTFEMPPVS